MPQTSPPTITAAPTPAPQRGDRTTFSVRVDAFVTWISAVGAEFGAVATNVYNNAVDAYNNAVVAATQATAATTNGAAQVTLAAAQVTLATTQAALATTNGSAQVSLAAAQVTLATTQATNAAASATSAVNAPGTSATSVTSAIIGLGSKSLTIQTGKSLVPGMWIVVADSSAPASNWMAGAITSYTSGTGALVFTSAVSAGTGTLTAWTVSLSAAGGASLGSNTFSGAQNTAQATVASSATTSDIWGAAGNQINWTGTATTTAFPAAAQAGVERVLICASACSFTASTNMLIAGVPSGSTVTCAPGDQMVIRSVSTTQFKLSRIKYDGTAQAGGLVYLSTVTASNVATADIETGFSALYDDYILLGSNVVTPDHLALRLKIAGTYLTTSTYRTTGTGLNSSAQSISVAQLDIDKIQFVHASLGTIAGEIELKLFNANSAADRKNLAVSIYNVMGGVTSWLSGSALNTTAGVCSGIRIYSTTGNISGTFKLYGISKT